MGNRNETEDSGNDKGNGRVDVDEGMCIAQLLTGFMRKDQFQAGKSNGMVNLRKPAGNEHVSQERIPADFAGRAILFDNAR